MKKLFRKLHLWLSVPFGLVISITCFSGAALVFETEIMELCYPGRYFVGEVREKTIPVEELLAAVAETLPDSVTITGVTISSDPGRTYQVGLSRPRRAGVHVDPYTGEVKERYRRAAFFYFMLRTHRWLCDSMKPDGGIFWGRVIVGVSTLLFVFILITGIVIWAPRTLKGLKNRLSIRVRKGWRRFWYDLHAAGGMYALIFLLLMALTGLTWSFSWYRTGFYSVFGVEARQDGGHGHAPQRQHSRQEGRREPDRAFMHWQKVYDRLNEQNPGHKQINLSDGAAVVTLNNYGNRRGADRYTFDAATGEITGSDLYKDQPKSGKLRGWIYSVHVGSWGGALTRILTFLAALIGGMLPLTGYYLWIRRVKRYKP